MRSTVETSAEGGNLSAAKARPGVWGTLLVVLCALLPYLAVRDFEHVHDDHELRGPASLAADPRVSLGELATADVFGTFEQRQGQSGYWRPLILLSFRIEAFLTGVLRGEGSWAGYLWLGHVVTLACHVLACLALLGLLRVLGLPDGVALFAAGLFAVHPVHVEPVAWTSGRTETLPFALACAAGTAWLRASGPGLLRLLLAAACLLAALLCKESAVVLLVFLTALAALRGLRGRVLWLPPLAALLAAGLLRGLAVGWTRVLDPAAHLGPAEASTRWFTWLSILPDLVGRSLWPVPATPLHLVAPAAGWTSPGVLAGLALLLLLVVLTGVALRRRFLPGLFATLLPLLTLLLLAPWTMIPLGLPEQSAPLADRYLYALTAGPVVLLAWILRGPLARAGRYAPLLLLVPLAALGPITAARAEDWRSDATFARAALRHAPGAASLWNHLGVARLEDLRSGVDPAAGEEARAAFQQALALEAGHPQAQLNLFITLALLGREEEAAPLAALLLAERPQDPAVLDNLAAWHALGGRWEEAIALDERQLATGRAGPLVRARLEAARAALVRGR